MGDARLLGGGNGIAVMRKPAAGAVNRIGADEQEAGGSLEGICQIGGVFKISGANVHALGFQCGERFRLTGGGNDLAGWNLVGFQEVADNELAQMAGSAGDEIHGKILLLQWSLIESKSQIEYFETGARRHFWRPRLHRRNYLHVRSTCSSAFQPA